MRALEQLERIMKTKQNKNSLIETETKMMVTRRVRVVENGKGNVVSNFIISFHMTNHY